MHKNVAQRVAQVDNLLVRWGQLNPDLNTLFSPYILY